MTVILKQLFGLKKIELSNTRFLFGAKEVSSSWGNCSASNQVERKRNVLVDGSQ